MSSIDTPPRALSESINIGQYSHDSVYGADGKQTARTFDDENRFTVANGNRRDANPAQTSSIFRTGTKF